MVEDGGEEIGICVCSLGEENNWKIMSKIRIVINNSCVYFFYYFTSMKIEE